jgi:hypothetical protein
MIFKPNEELNNESISLDMPCDFVIIIGTVINPI